MDTLETAKQTKTAYFIEYVYPNDAYGKQSFYFQLVRTKDSVWKMDISHKDVTIW